MYVSVCVCLFQVIFPEVVVPSLQHLEHRSPLLAAMVKLHKTVNLFIVLNRILPLKLSIKVDWSASFATNISS